MSHKVAEIQSLMNADILASDIAGLHQDWDNLRVSKKQDWAEVRDYVFATDTTTTANAKNEWSNSTTRPKLCHIRDNLHANYMAALFPNDNWFTWESYSSIKEERNKAQAIEAYMSNKVRQSGFKEVISELLYDYIDNGNPIAETQYVTRTRTDPITKEEEVTYSGPEAVRRSVLDVTFNPLTATFKDSPKIIRYIKTIGDLERDAKENPALGYSQEALNRLKDFRASTAQYSNSDVQKAIGFQVDGFSDMSAYLQSDTVEILEFKGSIRDDDGTYLHNYVITILDRSYVLRKEPLPSWFGHSGMHHAGWRSRPDNLYAMSPLENLVGLQYRIDSIENNKGDVYDLMAQPPIMIKGNVEEFELRPNAEIFLGDEGAVDFLRMPSEGLTYDFAIDKLEQAMEMYAGSPAQSAGIRTAGEKTAFEVGVLETNANKMFITKTANFETHIIEPLLNDMLEHAKRNLDGKDLVEVQDTDLGVAVFLEITKADLTSKGKLRPKGASHFAKKAALVQNLQGLQGVLERDQDLKAHFSAIKIAHLFEEALGLERHDLVSENIRVHEQAETARASQVASEQVAVEGQIDTDVPVDLE